MTTTYPRILSCVALLLALTACSSAPERPLQAKNGSAVDFSGSWELDYSQSDNIQEQLNALVREMRRRAERQNRGGNQSGGTVNIGGSGASVSR